MGYELSPEEQIAINEPQALFDFNQACNYASKLMVDVKPEYIGYNELWMLYFYSYYERISGEYDAQLQITIQGYMDRLGEMQDRGGLPWELEYQDDEGEDEAELKIRRQRGRMLLKAFEWLSPTSRGKKSNRD